MNVKIEQFTQGRLPPARLALKGMFACAMLAVIFLGAVYFLIDKDYTPRLQFLAALVGAVVGAVSAWGVNSLSSKD